MRAKYGIIYHPSANDKQVDRSIGICSAMKYLQAREKLTPDLLDSGLKDIVDQRNNKRVAIVAPSL